MAQIFIATDRTEEGEQYFKEAQDSNKNKTIDIYLLRCLGFIYLANKDYEQAKALFQKALDAAPNDHRHYFNFAVFYAAQSNIKETIKWLEQAIEKGYAQYYLIQDLILKYDDIRNDAEIKALMEQYFPDEVKE